MDAPLDIPSNVLHADIRLDRDPSLPPVNLTFALQFHFILEYSLDEFRPQVVHPSVFPRGPGTLLSRQRTKYNKLFQRNIIDTLENTGRFEFTDYENHDLCDARGWTAIESPLVELDDEKFLEDKEIELTFGRAAFQIDTPVMEYSALSLNHIEDFLETLRENFDILTDHTYGLHVHVGAHIPTEMRRWSRGFPLQTCKNLFLLGSLFEKQINAIHPPFRLMNRTSVLDGGAKCAPPSWFFSETDPLEVARKIQAISRIHTFDEATGSGHGAYNFHHLTTSRGRGAIKFQQHQATVDAEDVHHWVHICCRMVQLAYVWGCHGVPRYLRLRAEDSSFNTRAFLLALGLNETADYYVLEGSNFSRLYLHEPLASQFNPDLDGTRLAKVQEDSQMDDIEDVNLDILDEESSDDEDVGLYL